MAQKFLSGIDISGNIVVDSNSAVGATVLDIQGTQGQLFSLTNSLSGDLFSVSDISGIPILNVNSSGLINIDGKLGINNDTPAYGLDIDLDSVNDRINVTAGGAQKAIINGYGNIIAYGSLTSYNNSLGGGGGVFTYKGGTATQTIGHRFQHVSGNFTGSSGDQTMMQINPTINQTSSAGYTGIKLNVTETATGSGTKNLLDLQVGGTSKASISNAGNATFAGKVGAGLSPSTSLHVSGSSLTNKVAALIGGGWVGNDAYHKEGGLLLISGTNDVQTGAGIAFQTRNTQNTNYWKSSIIMDRDGALRFTLGGAGTTAGSNDFTILSNGNATFAGTVTANGVTLTGDQDLSGYLTSNANDSFSGILTGTAAGENLKVGGIRGTTKGSQTGEYIHLYERVHIGGPSGWGHSTHGAPSQGLSTWGSVDFGMNGSGVIQLDGTTIVTAARALTNIGTISSGAITSTGKIQGTELEGTSLDINGNADISGNLSGVDTYTGENIALTIGASASGRVDPFTALHASNNTITISQFGQSHADSPAANQIGVTNAEQHLHLITDTQTNMQAGTSTKGIFLRSGGNVGIGTKLPGAKLDVAGEVQATSLDINGNADISGNLGIGTASTSRQLSVFRSTAGSIANFLHYTDSSTFQGLYIQVSQTTNDVIFQSSGSGAGGFKFYAGNTEKAGIDASGNITLSGTVDGVDIAALAAANTGDQTLPTDFVSAANGGTFADSISVHGNILLTGVATTTNQSRMIDFTGFDKESTTDFTDRAYIRHTTGVGGHSGSVLEISSQNDATDGIAFTTNASAKLKWNSNNLATESYVGTAISNLVDSAPGTLNTLDELAAALGDDAAFSTTVTTALGNRVRVDTASQGLTNTEKSNARTNIGAQVAGSYAAASHNHDSRYYTETESTSLFTRKYDFSPGSNATNSRIYVKLFTLGNSDVSVVGKLSSAGDYGDSDRATYEIQIATRSNISFDVYQLSTDAVSDDYEFFYKAVGSTYEIWCKMGDYNLTNTFTKFSDYGSPTYNFDSQTTTQPSDLVAVTKRNIYHEGHLPTLTELGAQAAGSTAANSELLDNIDSASFLRSDVQDTYTPKRIDFGASSSWDSVGFAHQTNLHLQGHNQFWIGAGNATWFEGTPNTKSSTSGLAADATNAHDLLITTMQATSTCDRGITFAVDNGGAGTSGYRLGKWHSSDEQHSSKLTVDGGLHVRGGDMANFDYYADDYSTYWDNQGGQAYWGGDTGWIDPSITAGNAIQIQAGNTTTNTNNPALQFHQYGYGGVQFRYDGPNDVMHLESTGTNRFDYFQVKTDHGYFQMGAMNTSHVHLYTDRASFYSNKPILVNGTTLTGLQTSVSGSSGSCTGNAATASAVPWGGITSRPYIETGTVTSATTTTTVTSVVHATYTAAFFDFVIKNGTNVRAGIVYACHDGTNVEFAETSTVDLGDTSDVTLSVDISGTNMRLRATSTSSTWTIKTLIRAI